MIRMIKKREKLEIQEQYLFIGLEVDEESGSKKGKGSIKGKKEGKLKVSRVGYGRGEGDRVPEFRFVPGVELLQQLIIKATQIKNASDILFS